MNDQSIGEMFIAWAAKEPSIKAVLMLGSRARGPGEIGSWDNGSDWDFQVITSDLELFRKARWPEKAQLQRPLAYVSRSGRVARVTKSSGIFKNGDIDLVLLPLPQLIMVKWLMGLGVARRVPVVRNALAELSTVLSPGYRVIKDSANWSEFFLKVVSEISPLRLSDAMIYNLAEAYVVDYVSAKNKICRGEFVAAQRWLHIQLSEINFRLLHELRLRLGEPTFPDGRRIEQIADAHWVNAIRINAEPEREKLLAALEKSAATLRALIASMIGDKWSWPAL